jgi:hypothetical protein
MATVVPGLPWMGERLLMAGLVEGGGAEDPPPPQATRAARAAGTRIRVAQAPMAASKTNPLAQSHWRTRGFFVFT